MERDHFKTIASQFQKRPSGSPKPPSAESLVSVPSQAYCLQRAWTLANCYRKDEAHDAESYAAAIAAVLADGYALSVVDYVTDPRSGLPSSQKFLPNVAEIREACEARATTLRRLQQPPFKPKSQPIASKPRKPGQLNYAEFLKWAEENNRKPRPIGAFEPGGYCGPEKL